MNVKKVARIKRARKTRSKMREKGGARLCIHRTPKHMYVQLISNTDGNILLSASTVEKDLKLDNFTGNINAAKQIGKLIAERAKNAGIIDVSFDRSGFKYHGRVKALAESAREHGLNF